MPKKKKKQSWLTLSIIRRVSVTLITGGHAKQYSQLCKKSLKVSNKIKHILLSIQPSNSIHKYLLERNKNLHSYKNLYLNFMLSFSHSVVSVSLWPHGLQHARFPCPSPSPGPCSNSCHWVGDAIQPSHPLSSPLVLPSIFPSIRVFSYDSALSHQVAKVLELQLQHQSFQWIFRVDFL